MHGGGWGGGWCRPQKTAVGHFAHVLTHSVIRTTRRQTIRESRRRLHVPTHPHTCRKNPIQKHMRTHAHTHTHTRTPAHTKKRRSHQNCNQELPRRTSGHGAAGKAGRRRTRKVHRGNTRCVEASLSIVNTYTYTYTYIYIYNYIYIYMVSLCVCVRDCLQHLLDARVHFPAPEIQRCFSFHFPETARRDT